MESSNPAVVTNATRAPLRCKSVFVPTVVPCRTTTSFPAAAIFWTALPMLFDGSPDVENTLSIRRRDPPSQTQSVYRPPVSSPHLRGFDLHIDFQSSQAEK